MNGIVKARVIIAVVFLGIAALIIASGGIGS